MPNLCFAQLAGSVDPTQTGIKVSSHTCLSDAVIGSNIILCQVRVGGMQARAIDEMLPLEFGIPGDEGVRAVWPSLFPTLTSGNK